MMGSSFEVLITTAAGIFLIPCAVSDFRKKEISFQYLMAFALAALAAAIYLIRQGESSTGDLLLSLLPGIFLLLIYAVTGAKVGIGDGVVFLIIGLLIGCAGAFAVMFLSLIFSAVWSGYLMLVKKVGKDTSIPWMPFVLAGYLVWYGLTVVPELL